MQLPPPVTIPEAAQGAGAAAPDPDGDPVLFWNDQLLRAAFRDSRRPAADQEQGGPTRVSRAAAVVHAAIHDAVNGCARVYDPLLVRTPAPAGAGPRAAAGAAAYAALAGLYPRLVNDLFDVALGDFFDGSPNPADPGYAYGLAVGGAHLLARQGDGSGPWTPYPPPPSPPPPLSPPPAVPARDPEDDRAAEPPYRQKKAPGEWRSDPLDLDPVEGPQNPLTPGWGAVRPFTFAAGPLFRPPPFPMPGGSEYAAALADVKTRGRFATSTPATRAVAFFWSYDDELGTPVRLYNRNAWEVLAANPAPADGTGGTLHAHARLFALVNLAMADAGIVVWDAKFAFNHWRPVEGVRRASELNPLYGTSFADDPTFAPVGRPQNRSRRPNTSPPFPAYTSGHSGFGAALFRVLERFYGTDLRAFQLTTEERDVFDGSTPPQPVAAPGPAQAIAPRTFGKFSDAARENGDSRVLLGVHWSFDDRPTGQGGRPAGGRPPVRQLPAAGLTPVGTAERQPATVRTCG